MFLHHPVIHVHIGIRSKAENWRARYALVNAPHVIQKSLPGLAKWARLLRPKPPYWGLNPPWFANSLYFPYVLFSIVILFSLFV